MTGTADHTRRNNWLVILAALGALAVYVFTFCLPTYRANAEVRQQIVERSDYLSTSPAVTESLAATQAEVNRTTAFALSWRQAAPAEGDLAGVYGRIHSLAGEAGVTLNRFEPQAPNNFERIRRIPIQLGCTSNYPQLHNFLERLEALKLPLWIDGLQIRRGERGDSVSGEVTLVIFAGNPENSD